MLLDCLPVLVRARAACDVRVFPFAGDAFEADHFLPAHQTAFRGEGLHNLANGNIDSCPCIDGCCTFGLSLTASVTKP